MRLGALDFINRHHSYVFLCKFVSMLQHRTHDLKLFDTMLLLDQMRLRALDFINCHHSYVFLCKFVSMLQHRTHDLKLFDTTTTTRPDEAASFRLH